MFANPLAEAAPSRIVTSVICARVIEYLFWHERISDEIKRICRLGVTYLVTFPALCGKAPSQSRPAPDRTGRARIRGQRAEERYRAIEKDPPTGACPMNWVYVGLFRRGTCQRATESQFWYQLSISVCLIPIIRTDGFAGIRNV